MRFGHFKRLIYRGSDGQLPDRPRTDPGVRNYRTGLLRNARRWNFDYDWNHVIRRFHTGQDWCCLAVLGHGFSFTCGSGICQRSHAATKDLTVDFLAASAGQSAVLIGGELVSTQTVPAVTFYPDGTCAAFRLQLRAGAAAHVLNIDPWTCAQVLPRQEATP